MKKMKSSNKLDRQFTLRDLKEDALIGDTTSDVVYHIAVYGCSETDVSCRVYYTLEADLNRFKAWLTDPTSNVFHIVYPRKRELYLYKNHISNVLIETGTLLECSGSLYFGIPIEW